MQRLRPHLSYANVMATIAVFIALGGGAYAATSLPKNSVGSKQIKNNAITSPKVKDGSLLKQDFKAGQLPAGPQGVQGIQGIQGAKGDPGQNGATKVVVRTTTLHVSGAATALNEADCNSGERAVSGGVSRSDGSFGSTDVVLGSFPQAVQGGFGTPAPAGSTPTAWHSAISVGGATDLTFYVVCASP